MLLSGPRCGPLPSTVRPQQHFNLQDIGASQGFRPQDTGAQQGFIPQDTGSNWPQDIGAQQRFAPQDITSQQRPKPQDIGAQQPSKPQDIGAQQPPKPQNLGAQQHAFPDKPPSIPETATAPTPTNCSSAKRDLGGDEEDDVDGEGKSDPKSGRRKIKIQYITDKSRRHITFSKRKHGIMKKAFELSTLTGTQVLLLVVSETGLVYTFTTSKLQPLVTKPEGKNLIQACLNAPEYPPTPTQEIYPTLPESPSLYTDPMNTPIDDLLSGGLLHQPTNKISNSYPSLAQPGYPSPYNLPLGQSFSASSSARVPGYPYGLGLPCGPPSASSYMNPAGYWPTIGNNWSNIPNAFSPTSTDSGCFSTSPIDPKPHDLL